jgi:integrase/recombinase XerD
MAQPVEFAVAVEKYLDAAELGEASRRIYRIALTTWAWALVDRPSPRGAERRGAEPPVVPLAVLETAGERIGRAYSARGVHTANRELSILRSAVAWWRTQGWITADPTDGLRRRPVDGLIAPRLAPGDIRRVLALRAPLRDQTLWHAVHESAAPIEQILALNVDDVEPDRRRAGQVRWAGGTAQLMRLLLVGRMEGPVFLTDRRASAATAPADRCPLTGRGRLSYRRAAEIFAASTRALDPDGNGWTLRQLH